MAHLPKLIELEALHHYSFCKSDYSLMLAPLELNSFNLNKKDFKTNLHAD